eukprot:Gb_38935 [translate_table: standard]
MEQKNDLDQADEIILPGFRFHPTDEELVAFYLRRKVQQRPLSIELIKQLDIYKFDPWDLPKEMATVGEKEWYFYCPRDRKYRNSNRPNRVTSAGFWKATGTDRPIYSSDGTKCIGLKKSLVFYKGRAAKGIKTDWMMHEFRLPTSLAVSNSCKRSLDKDLPPNDSWAICRIFKKNTVAQRAPPHMWAPSIVESASGNTYIGTNFTNNEQANEKKNQTTTCSNPSSHITGDQCCNELQYPNNEESINFGSKFGAKSIMTLPGRSISLPNLEFGNNYLSYMNNHSSVKASTFDFVSCMLQMPAAGNSSLETSKMNQQNFSHDHHQPADVCTDHHHHHPDHAFELRRSIPSSPRSANINPLPFQSNLYDIFKGAVNGPWDMPTSTIL